MENDLATLISKQINNELIKIVNDKILDIFGELM